MNPHLPIPLRKALLIAMSLLSSQAFSAEYTVSSLAEFQQAWNKLADGDSIKLTAPIDFTGTSLNALPKGAHVTISADQMHSMANFPYGDMASVMLDNVDATGDGTVTVGSMSGGMLGSAGEKGGTLVIVKDSTVNGTSIFLESNKLVVGDNVELSPGSLVVSHSTSSKSETDPETGHIVTTVTVDTPGDVAIQLGGGAQVGNVHMMDSVRGKIVSAGNVSIKDSLLLSAGSLNTRTVTDSTTLEMIEKRDTVGALGGFDFSAGSVYLEDTTLKTIGEVLNSIGGDIIIGANSVLTAANPGGASLETGALILQTGLMKEDYASGTNYSESLGLSGNMVIGSNSSVENYNLEAEGSITIGAASSLSAVQLGAASVELQSVAVTQTSKDTVKVNVATGVGSQATVRIGDGSTLDDVDIYAEGGDIVIGSNVTITGDNDLSGSQMADIWAGDTVGSLMDEDATRGVISFDGVLKKNAAGDFVLASCEYSEGTYGGNIVIGDNVTLTMASVTSEDTITLGDNVTYQGNGGEYVYHMSAFSDSDNSLVKASITRTDDDGAILDGSITVMERENRITTGSGNLFHDSKAPGVSAAMDISRGGALYAHGDIIVGAGNVFENNTARGSGGAIFAQNNISSVTTFVNGRKSTKLTTETLDITVGDGTAFLGNTSGANGGAIASELSLGLLFGPDDDTNSLFDNEGANIHIGRNVSFIDNEAAGLGGAIHLVEGRTLTIGSGSRFDRNVAGGEDNDIFAEDGSFVIVNTDKDDLTIINSGLSDADYYSVEEEGGGLTRAGGEWVRGSANFIQKGMGDLAYGGWDTEENGFGGNFTQEAGSGTLVIGHFGDALESAQLGVEDLTNYSISGEGIALLEGSSLAGDKLTLNNDAIVEMADDSALLVNQIAFNGNSSVKAMVVDENGDSLDLTHTATGTAFVDHVAITGTPQNSLRLFNTVFVQTVATANPDGTYRLSQNMRGIAVPMQGYAGNVPGVAAGLEQKRLNAAEGSSAYRFFERLLHSNDPASAAGMIQAVSGEGIMNAAWASNDAVKGFASLVRTQGALSASRGMQMSSVRSSQAMDGKGSPMTMMTTPSGRGTVWIGGLGSWTDQNARQGIDGYKYDAGGYALGTDYRLGSSGLAGVAFGQTLGTFRDKAGYSDYDADSLMGMLYGRYTPASQSKLALDGYFAYGRTEFDGHSKVTDQRAKGKFDADSFGAAIYATWTEELSYKLALAPFAGLEFTTSKTDRFSERGDLGRSFTGARAQNWTLPVGVTLSRSYAVGRRTILTPALTVAVSQDLSRISPCGTVASDLGTWHVRGVNAGRTALRVNAGLNASFGSHWGASMGYTLESRAGLTAHGINGSVSYTF